jgi:hypothetical protein
LWVGLVGESFLESGLHDDCLKGLCDGCCVGFTWLMRRTMANE